MPLRTQVRGLGEGRGQGSFVWSKNEENRRNVFAPHSFKWLFPAGWVDFGGVKNRGLFKSTRNSCSRGEARPRRQSRSESGNTRPRGHLERPQRAVPLEGKHARRSSSRGAHDRWRSEKLAKALPRAEGQQSAFSDTNLLKGEASAWGLECDLRRFSVACLCRRELNSIPPGSEPSSQLLNLIWHGASGQPLRTGKKRKKVQRLWMHEEKKSFLQPCFFSLSEAVNHCLHERNPQIPRRWTLK